MKVASVQIKKFINETFQERDDLLAVEEPLEIRLTYGPDRKDMRLAVTMRTPGNDEELVTGFLFTESIIRSSGDIQVCYHCTSVKADEVGNVIKVELNPEVNFEPESLNRNFYTSSSCGVCGKSSIEAVKIKCSTLFNDIRVSGRVLRVLPDKLRKQQPVFAHTGGIHASGLFSMSGDLLRVREDVGRHNALDKLIGSVLIKPEPCGKIVVVSGRTSFELVQKAAIASIPILVAVGAPSSLAVDLAQETGMTLIGFTRKDKFNIYSGKERVTI